MCLCKIFNNVPLLEAIRIAGGKKSKQEKNKQRFNINLNTKESPVEQIRNEHICSTGLTVVFSNKLLRKTNPSSPVT